jgi:hypothetical protein
MTGVESQNSSRKNVENNGNYIHGTPVKGIKFEGADFEERGQLFVFSTTN